MNISDTIPVYGPINYPALSYFDPSKVVLQINSDSLERFPVNMITANRQHSHESLERLLGHLEEGELLILGTSMDWLLIIVLLSAFTYGVLRFFLGERIFGNITVASGHRFLEPAQDMSVLFHWNTIILHFISYLNLAIFTYCAFSYYNLIPDKVSGPFFILIATIFWGLAVLGRHIICSVTGHISGYKKLFNDYILSVYATYRIVALVLFVISILMLYTSILPTKALMFIALVIVVILFFFRFLGLFTAFVKSDVSIFYLILYLCALEILPVAVVVKYIQRLLLNS
jgi:hypothetical protein